MEKIPEAMLQSRQENKKPSRFIFPGGYFWQNIIMTTCIFHSKRIQIIQLSKQANINKAWHKLAKLDFTSTTKKVKRACPT